MFDGLLMHPNTRTNLDAFIKSPSHALLLVGLDGSGKTYVAEHLAAVLLGINHAKLAEYPYYLRISRPDGKKDIPIEAVREATKLLRLKVPGDHKINRLILVQDAHYMNAQAQNAFLKSLEEPPQGTVFILTSSSAAGLLPTIASRAQKIAVHPISLESASEFYGAKHSAGELNAAWQLSEGLAGLLNNLLMGENDQLKASIDQAKDIFRQNTYQRLISFDKIGRDKDQLSAVLEAMARITKVLYRQAATKGRAKQTKALLEAARLIVEAQNDLRASVSPKLVSLKLVLNLRV